MRVLVVEDERRLAAGLHAGLAAEGFAVDVALNGTDGLWLARENPYDVLVLDLMLPGVDGFDICRTLRDEGTWTPVMMLTLVRRPAGPAARAAAAGRGGAAGGAGGR